MLSTCRCFSRGSFDCISPLISLIHDQVQALKKLNISAEALNSDTNQSNYQLILRSIFDGSLRFLYLTPEKIVRSENIQHFLEKVYQSGLLTRFVVDEAHCVSQWGHDFRPDYSELGFLRNKFPKTPIMAFNCYCYKCCQNRYRTDIKIT